MKRVPGTLDGLHTTAQNTGRLDAPFVILTQAWPIVVRVRLPRIKCVFPSESVLLGDVSVVARGVPRGESEIPEAVDGISSQPGAPVSDDGFCPSRDGER